MFKLVFFKKPQLFNNYVKYHKYNYNMFLIFVCCIFSQTNFSDPRNIILIPLMILTLSFNIDFFLGEIVLKNFSKFENRQSGHILDYLCALL